MAGGNEHDHGSDLGGLGDDQGEIGPDWAENTDDPSLYGGPTSGAGTGGGGKKAARARKSDKDRPLQTPPFQIHRFDPLQKSYLWIAEWPGRKAPGPVDIRDSYGAGKYIVKDATKADQRWRIGANPAEIGGSEGGSGDETEPFNPPPPPHVAPGTPYARAGASPQYPGAGAGYGSPPFQQGYAPSPPVADPQLLGTFYRLDAAIQQISADQRRLQDELRSVTYELQQVPARVAERVSSAITEAVDPYDQMSKLWEMSRNMSEGVGPGEDKGPGMAEMVAALAGALAPRAPMEGAPPPAPPAIAAPAPPRPDLAGLTPEIKTEIEAAARDRGLTYDQAVELAHRQGWDAPQLLTIARSTAAPASASTAQ